MSEYFIGVDVGSFSVRSGLFLFENDLKLVDKVDVQINVFNDDEDFYEQSSENIWESICIATKKIIFKSNVDINFIRGISFDATCSLVALDGNDEPLSVSKSCDNNRNIIMWMDHRSIVETNFINKTKHTALQTVGGTISVEMQPPKILWLKKHLPQFMLQVSSLFDLPDYLTYRATGSKTRSLCSVTCKWAFDADKRGWDRSFWETCELSELCENNFEKIGNEFCLPGTPIKGGLSEKAAEQLGLKPGIIVPGSLIDAYAGMLGALSKRNQIVTIAGTSACHMILTTIPIYIIGVWGPYKNVLIENHYVLESGQSTVGILLDRILQFSTTKLNHCDVIKHLLSDIGVNEFNFSTIIDLPTEKWLQLNSLARDIHINPDFLGNRSPRSDIDIRGSIIGISLDSSASYISKMYLAAIHGLAYGFKEIVGELIKKDVEIDSIKLCGGLSKNALYVKVLADVSGIPVIISPDEDLVMKGTATLNIMDKVNIYDSNKENHSSVIIPDASLKSFHEEKFELYLKILDLQLNLKRK